MEGIDVHGDKRIVDWKAVRRSGVTFAFVKATEGRTFLDRKIRRNLIEATQAGVLVGPYHYARPDLSGGLTRARDEADFFVRSIRDAGWLPATHARPVLDIEVGSGNLTTWADVFCRRVEHLTGVTPIIYSYPHFIDFRLRGSLLTRYPLWLAAYGPNDGERHLVGNTRGPWTKWIIHQYTSNGRTPGVLGRCDRNYAPKLEPLRARQEPPDRTKVGMWAWIRWRRGHGEFKPYGKKNFAVRPNVPRRVPRFWWARYLLNLGIDR